MARLVPTARDKFAIELMHSTPDFFVVEGAYVCDCDATHAVPTGGSPVLFAYCARCDQAAVVFLQGEDS